MPMLDLWDRQLNITTLKGEEITFFLEDFSPPYPGENLIYIIVDDISIPCHLRSLRVHIPVPEDMEKSTTIISVLEKGTMILVETVKNLKETIAEMEKNREEK